MKTDAVLWMWDIEMPADIVADVFVAQLEVRVSEKQTVTTGYGVTWYREQSLGMIKSLCEEFGFNCVKSDVNRESFSLCFKK
jgi:hypothetical protein